MELKKLYDRKLQARCYCAVFTGKVKLPTKEQMIEEIEYENRKRRNKYVDASRHALQVNRFNLNYSS